MVKEDKLNKFMEVYSIKLKEAVESNPEEYAYGLEFVPTVLERMKTAIAKGSYNHHGIAFKGTCKELDIDHTRKSIQKYLCA